MDPLLVLPNSIYLVKKVLFKKAAHPILWANCVTIGLFFVLVLFTSPSSHNTSHQSTQKTTLTKSKKVGTKELNKEKARTKILTQEEKTSKLNGKERLLKLNRKKKLLLKRKKLKKHRKKLSKIKKQTIIAHLVKVKVIYILQIRVQLSEIAIQ